MILKTRLSYGFIEIKVDKIEETVFKDTEEVEEVIKNLLDVINDLLIYTDKEVEDMISDD